MRILALRTLPSHEFLQALQALRMTHPGCEVTAVLMTARGKPEIEAMLGGERVMVVGGPDGWWRLAWSLRRRRFDQALIFARHPARSSPRAWPAHALALVAPAAERRLVTPELARRFGWGCFLMDVALAPLVTAGALLLWLASLALVAVVLGADALRGVAGSGRGAHGGD